MATEKQISASGRASGRARVSRNTLRDGLLVLPDESRDHFIALLGDKMATAWRQLGWGVEKEGLVQLVKRRQQHKIAKQTQLSPAESTTWSKLGPKSRPIWSQKRPNLSQIQAKTCQF
jgi:hypothetical protein